MLQVDVASLAYRMQWYHTKARQWTHYAYFETHAPYCNEITKKNWMRFGTPKADLQQLLLQHNLDKTQRNTTSTERNATGNDITITRNDKAGEVVVMRESKIHQLYLPQHQQSLPLIQQH